MWIAPRVQFSGRPSGAPSELDANLIRGHLYPTDNPYPKQPNPRPRTITYFQPFLVQRLGSTSFIVKERLDGALANKLEVEILSAMRGGFRRILINLAEVTFLCSAGIRVILQYHRQMKPIDGSLMVSRFSPEVDEVLQKTGFKTNIVEPI